MGDVDVDEFLAKETALRSHPIAEKLNRAWMVVAQKR
jgi:hypothetical protein